MLLINLFLMLIILSAFCRISLGGPLFKLLCLIFTNEEWILKASNQDSASIASSSSPPNVSDAIAYIQQTLLLVLENISSSILNDIASKV